MEDKILGEFRGGVVTRRQLADFSNAHAYRVYNKSTGQVEEAVDVKFDEDNGSQGGRIDYGVVGGEIPPIVIRRMGLGEIIPVEGHLLTEGEGLCYTQVEPSPTTHDTQNIQQDAPSPQANEQGQAQDPPLVEATPIIEVAQPRGDPTPIIDQGQVQNGHDSDDEIGRAHV